MCIRDRVLALHKMVEQRENMMQTVVAGLEFESQVFQQRMADVVRLSQRYEGDPDTVFSQLDPQMLRLEPIPGSLHSHLSLIHISEPTRLLSISYAVFCLKKKKTKKLKLI
eukprot:TRINITY_DN55898_c0_g1_i1.p1 TRINITY_DN55898_c0_g1~~TRINITY_DN55898_c0_g1_i1.p1  ORF type:complete len:111 (+),score=28.52 TRINITY_DN55898_c0_g1_i1:193-525(+)